MTLTSIQIEEARQQLTLEAFAARQLSLSLGQAQPLWLCMASEVQQELLSNLRNAYKAWIAQELHLLVARVEGDPLARPGVLQVVPGSNE